MINDITDARATAESCHSPTTGPTTGWKSYGVLTASHTAGYLSPTGSAPAAAPVPEPPAPKHDDLWHSTTFLSEKS